MALIDSLTNITNIAHVIQLAVTPAFLLTGVGATLSVLVNRLGRVVDRYRVLEQLLEKLSDNALPAAQVEMELLSDRAKMVHWAIGLCTGAALFVCIVIATLFVGAISGIEMPLTIATLFVLAMVSLVLGLLCFLREIALAKGSIHVIPR